MTAQSIPVRLAGACSDIRLAAPADAVGGCQPSYIAAPASTKEASAVLRAAAELGLAVLPRGSGTRLHWGGPPGRCDLLVDTRRMNTVLEHAAGDLVARVQAGTGLRQLADVLGASGQRLALDPPPAGAQLPAGGAAASEGAANGHASGPGGTVGGLIATGVAGPLRLRYGTPRDLLIGITVVRPDGTGGALRRQGRQERGRLRHREAVRRVTRHAGTDHRGDLPLASAGGAHRVRDPGVRQCGRGCRGRAGRGGLPAAGVGGGDRPSRARRAGPGRHPARGQRVRGRRARRTDGRGARAGRADLARGTALVGPAGARAWEPARRPVP
jgi:FAD/FMN-containing dehydrogenase